MSKVIRISEQAYAKLNSLEEDLGATKQEILDHAIEKLARENLLKKANVYYAKLKTNKKAWNEELKSRAEWDTTLLDGLDEDDK